jgi:hypothetical protein
MNIDDLAKEMRSVSSEKVVQGLADLLMEWKQNHETVEDLQKTNGEPLTIDLGIEVH